MRWLRQPEPNYYNYWCTQVHGQKRRDTEDAPVFSDVWKQIESLIEGLPLVAHNKAFDESCLKAVSRAYQMDYPDYPLHMHRFSQGVPRSREPSAAYHF